MGLEAQRVIDVIRQAVTQMTRNGAMRNHIRGQAVTGGAYQISAYLGGSSYVSSYIDVPAGMYVPAGAYVEVVQADDETQVSRVMPTLFARLAVDHQNARVYLGNGSVEPADAGQSGYLLTSGGSGSAYWSPALVSSDLVPNSLILPQGSTPTQEGRLVWDPINNRILVGAGAFTSYFHSISADIPLAVSTSGSAGASASSAQSDHVHPHEAAHSAHDTIWDAKGDVLTGSGSNTAVKTSVGANDTVLTADSAAAGGVKWATVSSASSTASIRRVYTSGATWTKPGGLLWIDVECQGAGGGGGGAPATSGGQAAVGSGGGGGGYSRKLFTASALPSSCSVSVGTGGGGGSGADGSNGTNSTFSGSGITTVNGNGGGGGGASAATSGNGIATAGASGGFSGGDYGVSGGTGIRAIVSGGDRVCLGNGGNSMLGAGSFGAAAGAGSTGLPYGGGGSGAGISASDTSKSGGNGADGIVIVTEHY
jgi:hypothetical protein